MKKAPEKTAPKRVRKPAAKAVKPETKKQSVAGKIRDEYNKGANLADLSDRHKLTVAEVEAIAVEQVKE